MNNPRSHRNLILILAIVLLPILGFLVVRIGQGLNISWATPIIAFSMILYIGDVVFTLQSKETLWHSVSRTRRDKIVFIAGFAIFLLIIGFPAQQGIQSSWARFISYGLGAATWAVIARLFFTPEAWAGLWKA